MSEPIQDQPPQDETTTPIVPEPTPPPLPRPEPQPEPEPEPAPAPAPERQMDLIDSFNAKMGQLLDKMAPWAGRAGSVASFLAECFGPVDMGFLKGTLLASSLGLKIATGETGGRMGGEFAKNHPKCANLLNRFATGVLSGGVTGLVLGKVAEILKPGLLGQITDKAHEGVNWLDQQITPIKIRAFGDTGETGGVGLAQAVTEKIVGPEASLGIKITNPAIINIAKELPGGAVQTVTVPGEVTASGKVFLAPLAKIAIVGAGLLGGVKFAEWMKGKMGLKPKAA